jgi:hypothetical protein
VSYKERNRTARQKRAHAKNILYQLANPHRFFLLPMPFVWQDQKDIHASLTTDPQQLRDKKRYIERERERERERGIGQERERESEERKRGGRKVSAPEIASS